MIKLKPGDRIDRQIGTDDRCVIVPMVVRKIEGGLIYCEAEDQPGWPDEELWRFEELTGIEYDPDLQWGSEFGQTGSRLLNKIKERVMGYYINPSDGSTKESWLEANGTPLTLLEVKEFNFDNDSLPVCLVDNGPFTAAAIAYDARERDVFMSTANDRRPKSWFSAKKDSLKEWYPPRRRSSDDG